MKKELLHIEKENKSFTSDEVVKTQIMIGHTSRNLTDYLKSLELRHNGKYKKIPHYVVAENGDTISLLNPKSPSEFFGNGDIDNNIICVLLENRGWLVPKKNGKGMCDWLGDIYKGEVFDKKWRNKFFWAIYTDKQVLSLTSLLKQICGDFNINRNFIGHNVRVSGVKNFKGVVNRSNYSECFTDLSPAFNFEKIKELL
jgi:N-acetyl-anhydromuramyl-L-alanine amidase AmpD